MKIPPKIVPFFLILFLFLLENTGLKAQDRSEWFEFYLPWDDSSKTITDLSGFLDPPAGKYGFMKVTPEGHFSFENKDQRFRQVGVVNVAISNFPQKEESRIIAARMAKFGINLVRIHLIDVDWQHGIFRDSQSNTLDIHAERMDRMDYFTHCLKERGIYYNFCIQSGRIFKEGDGIDAPIENNQSKYSTLFNQRLIHLQKDYAEKTLAHKNPYTGLSYAQDPAMSSVELTNENSLFNGWFGWNSDYLFAGTTGGIGSTYAGELDSLFNQWLSERYLSDTLLAQAWSGEHGTGAELIKNNSFEDGTTGWYSYTNSAVGASATFSIDPDSVSDGQHAMKVVVSKAGTLGWHVNLKPTDFSVKKGESYKISFYARAEKATTLNVEIMENRTWYWYGAPTYTPGPEWKKFEFYFTCTKSTEAQIIQFNYGMESGTFWLDSVSISRFDGVGLEPGESLDKKNVKRTKSTEIGKYSPRRIGDNARFYFDLEGRYIDSLSAFLKNELQIRCPVTFTNNYYGLASIYSQSRSDYMDTHFYWDHPHYPNGWSNTDFTLHNRAMVLDPAASTLNRMSLCRVEGLPLVLSEYNHPYPQVFQAEAPSFLYAYGSLMDLDGILWHAYYDYHNDFAKREQDMFFDMAMNPVILTQLQLSVPYRTGRIQAHRQGSKAYYREQDVFDFSKFYQDTEVLNLPGGEFGSSFLEHGFTHADFNADSSYLDGVLSQSGSKASSDTGELTWDGEQGVFTVNSPYWQGVTGMLNGKNIDLSDVMIHEVSTTDGLDFAAIHLISLDSLPIDKSKRMLLLTSARLENEGFLWNASGNSPIHIGGNKALCEPVKLTLRFKFPVMDSSFVFKLNERGARSDSIALMPDNHGAVVPLDQKTLWYEILIDSARQEKADPTGAFVTPGSYLRNYPNPSGDFAVIEYHGLQSQTATLDLVNTRGQVVKSEVIDLEGMFQMRTRFDLSAQAEGLYLFRLRFENGSSLHRRQVISR